MSYTQVFSDNRTTIVTNLGGFIGSPNNLVLSSAVPLELVNNIIRFDLEIGYYFYFDYTGWGSQAFKFTQDLFAVFERQDARLGVSTIQMDTTNPKVTAFNTAKDSVITFNPNAVTTATYPTLRARHSAKIDLIGVNFIDGADGAVYSLQDVINLQGSLAVGGFASNLVRTAGSTITALNQIQARYWATITVQAVAPTT